MKKRIAAIVGRPNVGKSTLFNRLCRKRSAIVDSEEGITRDRKYEEVEWSGKEFILVDTGGIIAKPTDSISQAVKMQAELAIIESDLILFLVDNQVGITDLDHTVAKILLPHHKKVLLVANKADNHEDEVSAYGFMKLGFGEPSVISASHGRHIGDLLDRIIDNIETADYDEQEEEEEIRIAIVGKPNVGKSSILNRLVGENTAIVDSTPGTTRDSIDSKLTYYGKKFRFIDTAGLRRKKSISYGVELFSVMRTIESINRSDIVVLIIAADEPISDQDQKIASYAARNHKSIIVVVNKWDLLKKNNSTTGEFVKNIKEELVFIDYAPILFISALTNLRVRKILETIVRIYEQSTKRIPTSELNDFLQKILAKRPPTHSTGKHTKIYYCTQQSTNPPVFIFFCNNAALINKNYRRYLYNRLREEYAFEGASLKMVYRSRAEKDL